MEIKSLKSRNSNHEVAEKIMYESEVRQLEADYKEAIEALVRVQLFAESIYNTEISETAYKGIIEKAYGLSWKDIRREK